MKRYTVQPNQTFPDCVVQATGSMEAGMQISLANNISISDAVAPGIVLLVPDDVAAIKLVVDDLINNGIAIGSMGSPFAVITLEAEVGSDTLVSEDGQVLMVE